MTDIRQLTELLHSGNYSCVIANGNETRTFSQRGVADLYDLLRCEPAFLQGARVADKVVGKGAAALMVAGGVTELYADTLSRRAMDLLEAHGVPVDCAQVVSGIRNRAGTGWCPVEKLCAPLTDIGEMVETIGCFLAAQRKGAPCAALTETINTQ